MSDTVQYPPAITNTQFVSQQDAVAPLRERGTFSSAQEEDTFALKGKERFWSVGRGGIIVAKRPMKY
jgi:hypothetical protein